MKRKSEVINFVLDSIGIDGGYENFMVEGDEGPIYYGSPEKDVEFMNALMKETIEAGDDIETQYHLTKGKILSISIEDLKMYNLIGKDQIKYPLIMRSLTI